MNKELVASYSYKKGLAIDYKTGSDCWNLANLLLTHDTSKSLEIPDSISDVAILLTLSTLDISHIEILRNKATKTKSIVFNLF